MKKIKPLALSALVITLAANMAVDVAAQDEPAEPVAPAWVTGELRFDPTCTSPTSETDGAVRHEWGFDCDAQTWATDDPRLSGEVRAMWNGDVYSGPNISVITSAYHLRNDAGAWACRSNSVAHGSGWYATPETGETVTCDGEGGNEGMSAILVIDGPASGPLSISGLIFPGDLPPLPEPPASE